VATNERVDDMAHGIAGLFEPLLRFLFRASGRHRAPASRSMTRPQEDTPTIPHLRTPALRGEDIGLVRPYLVAHERREKERRRRAGRRTLVFATYALDIGLRRPHGVKVAA
jgi:hypothetical protein